MFDVSFWELSVICVITLLVVGPERLPGLVRDVGRIIRKLRRIVTQTRYELEREFSFEEERRKLEQKKDTLSEAIDELDDLMDIAPDRDTKDFTAETNPSKTLDNEQQ
jgi:sec-independent protein translocase protein TatB